MKTSKEIKSKWLADLQWRNDRQSYIGGSDVAGIMGISPWSTPLDIYLSKTEPLTDVLDFDPTDDLSRGTRAEKYILEEYMDRNQVQLQTNVPLITHNKYPFMKANVDAINVDDKVIIEAKSTKSPKKLWDKNGIPEYYKTQVAYYRMITNAHSVEIPVLFSGWEYDCYSYIKDEELENNILEAVLHFWNTYILKSTPPPPSTLKEIENHYKQTQEKTTIEANHAIDVVIQQYIELKAEVKKAKEQEEIYKGQLLDFAKQNKFIKGKFGVVAITESSTSRFDSNAFKKDHKQLYDQYQKISSSKTIRIQN